MKPHNTASLLAAAAVILSQLACQTLFPLPSTPTPLPTVTRSATATATPITPTATPVPTEALPFTDYEITTGIQQALDIYADALTNNKPELLKQIVDQENRPLLRIVNSRFDDFQKSYMGGQVDFEFSLQEIVRREHGFVIARFRSGRSEASWLFRYDDGAWVLGEPGAAQIGEPVITETEHFKVTSYPWAEDVNPHIIEMLETAREEVEDVLGKVPVEKPNVEIIPIYGLRPFESMQAVASYSRGTTATDDQIVIYTPNSFAFAFYDYGLGWESELQDVLTHEYTHMAHARSFHGAGRLADWMSEGLAEYVAGETENSSFACEAMQMGTTIPILDETRDFGKQDLMNMYGLEQDFGLSYDFATSVVEFTVEKYGGLDGFWKLAHELDEKGDLKKALLSAFGVSYSDFNTQWQAWLRKKC